VHEVFECPGEIKLIVEAHFPGHLGYGQFLIVEQATGSLDFQLIEVGDGRETGFSDK